MSKFKKTWNDPVYSKLIAEGFKSLFTFAWGLLIIPLIAFIKSIVDKASFWGSLNIIWSDITSFFDTGFHANLLSIILIIAGYLAFTVFIKWLLSFTSTNKLKNYNSDKLWDADIKWKWIKENGVWEIKYGDYELSCPRCYHDLIFEDNQGQHRLKCKNIYCSFRSIPYYYEPPSRVVILADMETFYFHNALKSSIYSRLRRQKIKR